MASCEHRGKRAAQAKAAQIQGEFDAFVANVARQGEVAEAERLRVEGAWKEANDVLSTKIRALGDRNRELRDHLERLRLTAPVDPSGRPLPTTACGPEGVGGEVAGERLLIGLDDYRALEARAAYDAQTVILWREWASLQGLMREP